MEITKLQMYRRQQCLTQTEVAKKLNVADMTLWRLEHYRTVPRPEIITKLAYIYKKKPTDIYMAVMNKELVQVKKEA